ncbi:MAG: sugar phosphate isomerase/epimerase [Syntrophales bacterium]|jgi:sugar phosphate isomerase/epimerase|nr:sugar phosphate isomerase/epimerase [Syntrophales bacterium]MCK9528100.1 sugar phosphate isomerase/epimerase [Syntrophales bacterium]MDX9922304.1 sugar phosphate isomerase/epimerase family protein [Syntrophales bacterium]
MNAQPILERVQVNMPYRFLIERYFPVVLEEGIHLEIGFDCFALDGYSREHFRETAKILQDAGLEITFHAPFYDLRPGALDEKIREVTAARLAQVFDLVPFFNPRSVVCHAAFDRRYYVSNEEAWLENSIRTWTPLVRRAGELGTSLMLENVYEDRPDELKVLLEYLKDVTGDGQAPVGLCFDTGHWNAFSLSSLEVWMAALGPCIGQIHLHDNDGSGDQHLPVGEGTFPFQRFMDALKKAGSTPIVTLEPHTREALEKSLEKIDAMNLLDTKRP